MPENRPPERPKVPQDILYRPVETVFMRCPSLPAAHRDDSPEELSPDLQALFHLGVAIASPSLALARVGRRDDPPVLAMRHYVRRASSRATPFGVWAAVFTGGWGVTSDVVLGARRRLVPDIDLGWFDAVVRRLEADPRTRARLLWRLHPAAFESGGRLVLTDARGPGGYRRTSVRLTPAVRRVVEKAGRPTAGSVLAAEASKVLRDARRAEQLIAMLCDLGVLTSEITPRIGAAQPVWRKPRMLTILPKDARHRWTAFTQAVSDLGRPSSLPQADAWRCTAAAVPLEASRQALRADLVLHPVRAEVARDLGDEIADVAQRLVRTSRFATGLPHIAAYARAVADFYGQGRPIPVLELLDPGVGLGPPATYPGSRLSAPPVPAWDKRSLTLTRLLAEALRHGRDVVQLDDALLDRLAHPEWDPQRTPATLDVAVKVIHVRRTGRNTGSHLLVLNQDTGICAGGRHVGRFARTLGAKAAEVMSAVMRAETQRHPGLHAEVTYLPADMRALNVALRPIVYPYELPVGAWPTLPASRQISPLDLSVVSDGRSLRLIRTSTGESVYAHESHLLSHSRAPNLVRLVADLTASHCAVPEVLGWEDAENYPYLPRLQWRNTVFSPRRWMACADDDTLVSMTDFERWLVRWRVPKRVDVGSGSQQIGFDLSCRDQLAEMWRMFRREGTLRFQEDFSSPEGAWANGSQGAHHVELVATLTLDPACGCGDAPNRPAVVVPPEAVRRAPGSEWLYVRLYTTSDGEDAILTGPVSTLARRLAAEGIVHSWHFLRYSEPERSLRVRFQGSPERLLHEAWPAVCQMTTALMQDGLVQRMSCDTYEREVSRYGGEEALNVLERVWGWDSAGVAGVLASAGRRDIPAPVLGALLQERLLTAIGFDESARLALYENSLVPRHLAGGLYRRWGRELLAVGGDSSALERLADVYMNELQAASSLDNLPKCMDPIDRTVRLYCAGQLVHLQAHRLGRPDWNDEATAMALARRVLEGRRAIGALGSGMRAQG